MDRPFVIREGGETFTLPELLLNGIDIKRVDSTANLPALIVVPPEGKTIENGDSWLLPNLNAISVRQDSFGNYWVV